MLRLRRAGEINENMSLKLFCSTLMTVPPATSAAGLLQVRLPERLRLWSVSGEVRVPHRGNVVDRVIEGAYRWWACLTGLRKSVMPCSRWSAATGTPGAGTGGADLPLW